MVERLLRCVPDCEVALLVRPGRRTGAVERVRREILRNDCFDRLRATHGSDWDEVTARRVHVMAGDVAQDGLGLDDAGRELLASCDMVIHSAAAVSFDSPLDLAVEVNLLGPTRVAQALQAVGSSAHLIAVSTAYVAGGRRGTAPEALLPDTAYATDVDWRAEVAAARRARADIDAASRQPKLLATFHKKARAELGAAGSPVLADKTERLREEWVKHHLIQAGIARAQSLGRTFERRCEKKRIRVRDVQIAFVAGKRAPKFRPGIPRTDERAFDLYSRLIQRVGQGAGDQ